MQPGEISSSERMWAALAHSILLLNVIPVFLGPSVVITMGIWVFKRKGSDYVGFQALQAFIFQVAVAFLAIILGMVIDPAAALIVLILPIIYSMYGAYRCNQGHEFRYVVIGDFLTSIITKDK